MLPYVTVALVSFTILTFVVVYNSLCCLVNICANKTTNETGTSNIVIQLKHGYQILVLIKILPTNCYSIALENPPYQSTVFIVGYDIDMFRITL
jgi:hypothetical protein